MMSLSRTRRARRVIRGCVCLSSVLALAALSARPGMAQSVEPGRASGNAGSETRIRAIIEEQVGAWNAGNAKAFSLHFAEDGSFTNIQGAVFYGHRAFE